MSLSDRIRAESEAAPWVIEAVAELENDRDWLTATLQKLCMRFDAWANNEGNIAGWRLREWDLIAKRALFKHGTFKKVKKKRGVKK